MPQDTEYLQAQRIITELETKLARFEAERAAASTPELEATIARLQSKLAAKKAAMPSAPVEPESHAAPVVVVAPIVEDVEAVTDVKPAPRKRRPTAD